MLLSDIAIGGKGRIPSLTSTYLGPPGYRLILDQCAAVGGGKPGVILRRSPIGTAFDPLCRPVRRRLQSVGEQRSPKGS